MRDPLYASRMRALLISLVLLSGSVAAADRIPAQPLPTNCPPGSVADIDHGGPHCGVTPCTSEDDCYEPNNACSPPLAVCVVTQEFRTYSRRAHPRAHATGTCGADDACAEGDCRRGRFCVAPGSTAATVTPATMEASDEPPPEPTSAEEPTDEPASMSAEPASATTMATQTDAVDEGGCAASGRPTGAAALVGLVLLRRRRTRADRLPSDA